MTRRVKIGEAKTHLSTLLAEVEAGEDLNAKIKCGVSGNSVLIYNEDKKESSYHSMMVLEILKSVVITEK